MPEGQSKYAIALLAGVGLFSSCSPDELATIWTLGTIREFDKGDDLVLEGAPGTDLFLILEGDARCTTGDTELATFSSGDFFGELALLEGGYRSATVTATGPITVFELPANEFRQLLVDQPEIALRLLAGMAKRLRQTDAAID